MRADGLRDGRELGLVALDVTLLELTGPYLSELSGDGPLVVDASMRPLTPRDLARQVPAVDFDAAAGRVRERLGAHFLLDALRRDARGGPGRGTRPATTND